MLVATQDMEKWTLDPTKAAGPQLRRIIRSRVVRNDLKPNSKISEKEIAEEYDVSRQPVREAFITLAHEGLLEIRPQRGTIIKKIDYSAVLDARFVREAVEADIIKVVAGTADGPLIEELRAQLVEQERVLKAAKHEFIELDELFHRTLANAAGRSDAWRYIEVIKSQMDRVRIFTIAEFPLKALVQQHWEIFTAIERNDPELAEQAMRQHLREILKTLPEVLQRYPENFENTEKALSHGPTESQGPTGSEKPSA